MKRGIELENVVLIGMGDKIAPARSRIAKATGKEPVVFQGISAASTSANVALSEVMRNGNVVMHRERSWFGAHLSWISVLAMARAMKWDSVTIFEDDVIFAPDFNERLGGVVLFGNEGVFNLGPILWMDAEKYGTLFEGVIYNYSRLYPYSAEHAVHIQAKAFDWLIHHLMIFHQSPDDLFALGCQTGPFETLAFYPPIAYQSDRPETKTGNGADTCRKEA
jgi:GR25 family glycosyltransferase involved in LPS biosynthesis